MRTNYRLIIASLFLCSCADMQGGNGTEVDEQPESPVDLDAVYAWKPPKIYAMASAASIKNAQGEADECAKEVASVERALSVDGAATDARLVRKAERNCHRNLAAIIEIKEASEKDFRISDCFASVVAADDYFDAVVSGVNSDIIRDKEGFQSLSEHCKSPAQELLDRAVRS